MSSDKSAQPYRMRKASKRVLVGETLVQRKPLKLEKEIAAHPVTRCERGERSLSSSRPGSSSEAVHSTFRAERRRRNRD